MYTHKQATPVPGLFLSVSLLLLLLILPVSAEPPSGTFVAHLTSKQAASFDLVFTSLAQETHTAIVIEDQPLKTILAPGSVPATPEKGEALSTLLPRIAAAYDYDVSPLADNSPPGRVFLLTKRFTDPNDLPDVTLAEVSQSFTDIGSLIEPYDPHLSMGLSESAPPMRDFLLSLTPAQMLAMVDKEHGLPVGSLTPPQQEAIQKFMMFFCVQVPNRSLKPVLEQVGRAGQSDPEFCRRDINDLTQHKTPFAPLLLFGYEAPDASGKRKFGVLNRQGEISQQGGATIMHYMTIQDGLYAFPDRPDSTNPVPQGNKKPAPTLGSTLAEIVGRLNRRPGSRPPVLVDAALAPKRAAVFGEEFTSPKRLLQALAELYGLHVDTDEKERSHLTRRHVLAPDDYAGVYQAAQGALPDPLLRAYRMHPGQPSALGTAAVRELRAVIEPKIDQSLRARATAGGVKDKSAPAPGQVRLSSLTGRENSALAVALAAQALPDVEQALLRPLPPVYSRLDQLCLTGGFYQDGGKRKFQLAFAYPSADGKGLASGPGVSNLNFPAQPEVTTVPAAPEPPN